MRQLYGLPHGASDLADPIITPQEAMAASTAICRHHNGIIGQLLSDGDYYGRAYYCPVGRMYWRLSPQVAGMHTPLNFPKGL